MAGSRRPSRGCILQSGTRAADNAAVPNTPDHHTRPVSGKSGDLTDEQFDRKCGELVTAEEWRAVLGYEGKYEISSLGRIRRVRWFDGGKLLRPQSSKSGYLAIRLRKNGGGTPFTIHRLVAEAFLGPRPAGMQINHVDGVKANNAASNLEYATPRQNTQHAVRLGLFARRHQPRCGNCKATGHNQQTCAQRAANPSFRGRWEGANWPSRRKNYRRSAADALLDTIEAFPVPAVLR